FVRHRFLRGELELTGELGGALERCQRGETPYAVEIPLVARRRGRLRRRQVGGGRSLNEEEQRKHAHARKSTPKWPLSRSRYWVMGTLQKTRIGFVFSRGQVNAILTFRAASRPFRRRRSATAHSQVDRRLGPPV